MLTCEKLIYFLKLNHYKTHLCKNDLSCSLKMFTFQGTGR